jgi:hypothetical protein
MPLHARCLHSAACSGAAHANARTLYAINSSACLRAIPTACGLQQSAATVCDRVEGRGV